MLVNLSHFLTVYASTKIDKDLLLILETLFFYFPRLELFHLKVISSTEVVISAIAF